ncbi:hypothetical protein [Acidipropionibacterium acidipropionici]|nr:hypothetical protein [Acidipropionibacterium acidipropionici]
MLDALDPITDVRRDIAEEASDLHWIDVEETDLAEAERSARLRARAGQEH